MPSVDDNLGFWDSYSWSDRGEEWSQPWGNAALQWAITIYPRIMRAIPADTILEIAPGFGRWVPFLLAYSRSYIGIDISPRCISYCRDVYGRLRQRPQFSVGDGTSFPGVENSNVSFVFSFELVGACRAGLFVCLHEGNQPGSSAGGICVPTPFKSRRVRSRFGRQPGLARRHGISREVRTRMRRRRPPGGDPREDAMGVWRYPHRLLFPVAETRTR